MFHITPKRELLPSHVFEYVAIRCQKQTSQLDKWHFQQKVKIVRKNTGNLTLTFISPPFNKMYKKGQQNKKLYQCHLDFKKNSKRNKSSKEMEVFRLACCIYIIFSFIGNTKGKKTIQL